MNQKSTLSDTSRRDENNSLQGGAARTGKSCLARLFFTLHSSLFILLCFAPLAVKAANQTVSIQGLTTGEAIQNVVQNAINAASGSGTITVTGAVDFSISGDVRGAIISLTIPTGITVRWQASLIVRSDGGYTLMNIIHGGIFEVPTGGMIEYFSRYGGPAIAFSGNSSIYGGVVIISGGLVSVLVGNYAIESDLLSRNLTINISGGTVDGISTKGENSAVNVSSGEVFGISCHGTVNVSGNGKVQSGGAIITINAKTVTVSGNGKVQALNYGYAIQGGTVNVEDNAEVSAAAGIGIRGASNVTVSGGMVSATTGCAIQNSSGEIGLITVCGNGRVQATGANGCAILTVCDIEVKDNAVVSATTGYAISSSSSDATVTVSGGLVFAYGTAITGNNNVIDGRFDGPTGTGMVVAWNRAAGRTSYFRGIINDLIVQSSGVARWDIISGKSGIAYFNGEKMIFMEVEGVTVIPGTTINLNDPGPTSGTGWTYNNSTNTYTITGDVTVVGNVTGATQTLTLDMAAGKTAFWEASLSGNVVSYGFSRPLVNITNGNLRVADGSKIEQTGADVAISTTGHVTVNGGEVNAASSCAIVANGANSTVDITGGVVKSNTDRGNSVIYVTHPSNTEINVRIRGKGKVQATSADGYAIRTKAGTIEVKDNAEVITNTGIAICAEGENSKVVVSGGTVCTTTGIAISAVQPGSLVIVSGGTVSSASDYATILAYEDIRVSGGSVIGAKGCAVYAYDRVIVSGGIVFAYGSTIEGFGNVAYFWLEGPTETGVIIAWNQAAGNISYVKGHTSDLTMLPAGCAKWDIVNGKDGITYENGTNKGFIEIEGVTITNPVDAQTPNITTHPQGSTVTVGTTHNLTVAAMSPDGGTLSYQWYKSTSASNTGGTTISGATNATYAAPVSAVGTFYYYVVVTNTIANNGDGGTKTAKVTSNVATLTVNAKVNAQTPIINTHPQGATLTVGTTRNLTVAASVTDGGTLSYQWYKSTSASNTGGTTISGATNATYAAPISTAGTFHYYVVVTNTIANNGDGGAKTATASSNVATLTVNAKVNAQTPTITTHPQGATVTMGTTRNLTVAAGVTDGGTLSYQWYKNTSASNTGGTSISGATGTTYAAPISTAGTFHYYVVVTNTIANNGDGGTKTATATSNVATLTVNAKVNAQAPTINKHPQGATLTVGTTRNLTVAATSLDGGTLSYQWYKNTTESNTGGTSINGATNAIYAAPINTAGTSHYYVVVTNIIANNGDGGTKTATKASNVATLTVTQTTITVTGVSLNKSILTLAVGGAEQLMATVAPANATNKNVTWSSSNAAVATVSSDGTVTAQTVGTATITVTTQDGGKTAVCTVTVTQTQTPVAVTGVSLNKSTLTLAVGSTEQLTATVAPADATNKDVTWSSDNTVVATVGSDGTVTAQAAGSATITVTTQDGGKTATCTVTVTEDVTETEDFWNAGIKLYPNPFTDRVHLTGAEGCTLRIVTENGAAVHVQKITNPDETIPAEHLPEGMYFFHLEKDGKAKTMKGVKN